VGESLALAARAETASGDGVTPETVTWSVSRPEVARVEGMGTGVTVWATSPGEVALEATMAGTSGVARLVVVPAVTALSLSPDGGEVEQGQSISLRVMDQDGEPLEASFRSDDPSVATVSASGALQAVTPGEVTVVVSAAGLTLERSFSVAPAPSAAAREEESAGRFRSVVEVDERPRLATPQAEVERVTNEEYPPLLRENGVGGAVVLRLYIGAGGEVVRQEVSVGSGRAALDEAAGRVARQLRFEPALVGGQAVRVYIDQPILFQPGR
jgi:TonB family protein